MTAIYGGSSKFIELLSGISSVKCFSKIDDALKYTENEEVNTLFLLPRYTDGDYCIPEFSDEIINTISRIIANGKTKIYVENYPAYDYRDCFIFGLQARGLQNNLGRLSLCLSGSYKNASDYEILQKRNGFYYPAAQHTDRATEILLEIKNCIGIHHSVCSGKTESIALLKNDNGVFCSMADLTNLNDPEIFSYSHWKNFYKMLLCELTGAKEEQIEKAFSEVYKRIGIMKAERTHDKKKSLEDAVRKSVVWHEASGIMIDGGRGGVYEMFRSFDLNVAKNLRGDSSLFTAALFMAAGVYFGNEEYKKTAEAIASFMLEKKALQIKTGENRGLFKWFSGNFDLGTKSIYVSDSSRVGNSVFALYKLTGEKRYLDSVVSLGDALLRWFGGEALLPGCYLNYAKDDLLSIQKNKRRASPEFYDAPLILLGNLFSATKDTRYKEQIIKTATALSELYPDFEAVASHSDNFTYGRLLGALSVAQQFGDGIWTEVIDKLLLYFKDRQHKTGGFAEGKAYFDEKCLERDMEFAVGLGIDDNIADFVYCQNTLAYSLNILLSRNGRYNQELARELFDSLTEFLLDTQISSNDPRLDGAWMRAFDMDGYEYYGCDKDFAWGPYCILTGWVTGAIPLVFLDILGLKTMY